MGLKEIELVMNVEDEFGIVVPDDVAASDVRTVGDLYDAVLPLVRSGGKKQLAGRSHLDEFVWNRLCEMSAKLAKGVKPADITRETRFTEDLGYH